MNWLIRLANFFKRQRKAVDVRTVNLEKDIQDDRDYVFSSSNKALPSRFVIDYKANVRQQGRASSCTGHAVVLAYEIERQLKGGVIGKDFHEGSEHHNYYHSRHLSKLFPNDRGAYLRDAVKVAKTKGVAPEVFCRYNDSNVNRKPFAMAEYIAAQNKIKEYYRLVSLKDVKASVAANHPVICAIPVGHNWTSARGSGVIQKEKTVTGRHAFVIVGYDDTLKAFKVQNSWGLNWADKGFAWVSYDGFKDFDTWTIRAGDLN